ncbi:MAG: preprotein translocase subunit YajC [Oscillospiraceae bacterium]
MDLLNLITLASGTDNPDTTSSLIMTFLPMILILIFFYFFLIRPQKKQEKEAEDMRKSIEIGDEIETIGGIVGIVVRQTDDTVVIETGGERNKLRIKKWAIKENLTQHENSKAQVQAKSDTKPDKEDKHKKSKKDDILKD